MQDLITALKEVCAVNERVDALLEECLKDEDGAWVVFDVWVDDDGDRSLQAVLLPPPDREYLFDVETMLEIQKKLGATAISPTTLDDRIVMQARWDLPDAD